MRGLVGESGAGKSMIGKTVFDVLPRAVTVVDGSVRTLAPSMSGATWWAAVTPSGGEVTGSDWK